MKRLRLVLGAVVGLALPALAHDPFEINSVAYLYSNRIEIFVEMEFPTGMTLAGQKPVRDVAALSQFEAALPQLRELAGSFYDLNAGNNVVLPLATNVELVVEDHIRLHLEYTPTPHRPVRFIARGLGVEANDNPYGVSLTVLDMVNQKVLGQTTLFAAKPVAEFPPRAADSTEVVTTQPSSNVTVVVLPSSQPAAAVATTSSAAPARKPNWILACATLGAVFLIVFAFVRLRE